MPPITAPKLIFRNETNATRIAWQWPVCILFLLSYLCFFLPVPAAARSVDDILVVYNAAVPASREVAEHYKQKRNVPPGNVLGLTLPDSEHISRREYDRELTAPLRVRVEQLRAKGRQPIILLVYGMPLKVGDEAKPREDDDQDQAAQTIAELGVLVQSLAARLDMLTGTVREPASSSDEDKRTSIPRRAEEAIRTAAAFQVRSLTLPDSVKLEINSLIIRLTGLTPLADGLMNQASAAGKTEELRHDNLLKLNAILGSQLSRLSFFGISAENLRDGASLIRLSKGILGELQFRQGMRDADFSVMTSASVDSELAMVLVDGYQKARWLSNPYLSTFDSMPGIETIRNDVVMVARLDGPTPAIAKRLVDDALAVEDKGLTGIFYIDARGLGNSEKGDYYAEYDRHLLNLAAMLKGKTSMRVVVDDRPDLLAEKSAPDAALYCGWYSLAEYIDAFTWRQGAVGFHVASSEASTLRRPESHVWCKRMLEEGVAATLGPVQEPYLHSFPLPDVFFPLLMGGRIPLIEVYFRSIPNLSWRQVLIGDPLYTPFKNNPAYNGQQD